MQNFKECKMRMLFRRFVREASHRGSKQQQIMLAISLTIACSRYIYYGVILHTHRVRGESHNQRNTTGEVATVVVRKKDGKVRICVDYTRLNRAVRREHHVMPTVDTNLKVFSKLDARSGLWQIPLSLKSKLLTTFQNSERSLLFQQTALWYFFGTRTFSETNVECAGRS